MRILHPGNKPGINQPSGIRSDEGFILLEVLIALAILMLLIPLLADILGALIEVLHRLEDISPS